jgi:hypothetical protein
VSPIPPTLRLADQLKPSAAILTALLLALGLVSFIYVRAEAGQGDTFVQAQHAVTSLTAAGVARTVQTAPEQRGGPRARAATCESLGSGELRNPWRCLIVYPDGTRVQYTVQIRLNGSYSGSHQLIFRHGQSSAGSGQISGCCVQIP